MEQVFISMPIADFEIRISDLVEAAVSRALAQKEPAKYFSMQEAAKFTGKALSTLYTDHSRGRLTGFKSGRHVRFTEQQLVIFDNNDTAFIASL